MESRKPFVGKPPQIGLGCGSADRGLRGGMGLRSMTGFAREAGATGTVAWAWECRTVNGRGLDIRLRTPPGFDAVGEEARRLISSALSRGQCHLTLAVESRSAPGSIRLDRVLLKSLLDALGGLERPAGIGPVTLDGLLSVRGVVVVDEDRNDAFDDTLRADLVAAAARLATAIGTVRAAEGAALAGIIEGQVAALADLVAAADRCPSCQPDAVRARLEAQIRALAGASPSLDPVRLHQEAALLATRADIREEIDRLKAHLEAVAELVVQDGSAPVGRRLDFLAQELGREANTLCAKANDVALSRIGLDLKVVVEQFREQVQNVE